jgi:hypothetical protein
MTTRLRNVLLFLYNGIAQQYFSSGLTHICLVSHIPIQNGQIKNSEVSLKSRGTPLEAGGHGVKKKSKITALFRE